MHGQIRQPADEARMANELTRQAAAAHNRKSSFLNLPGEIRNAIYNAYAENAKRSMFARISKEPFSQFNFNKSQGLGQVCRQIRVEYKSIYRKNHITWTELESFRGFFRGSDFNYRRPYSSMNSFLPIHDMRHYPEPTIPIGLRPVAGELSSFGWPVVPAPTVPADIYLADIWTQYLMTIANLLEETIKGIFDEQVWVYFTHANVKHWMLAQGFLSPKSSEQHGSLSTPRAREQIARLQAEVYDLCQWVRRLSQWDEI